MSTTLLYLSQIRTAAHNLLFEKVEEQNGQFNDVVIVNHEWVFRFPRYREGVQQMVTETRLLEALKNLLPLAVPSVEYQRIEPPVPGLAFIGYKRLPGEALSAEAVASITDDNVLDRIAVQLADFLRMLHAMPLHVLPVELLGGSNRARDGRDQWEEMYSDVREKLFPAMRPDARKAVSQHFEAYLDEKALHRFDPVLRHGDFGGSNILWDPAQRGVTGVIDFSSCAPGDPAYDLASISTTGEDLFARIAVRYQPDAEKLAAMLARARFHRGTFALEEALDGLKNGDESAYRAGMEEYT